MIITLIAEPFLSDTTEIKWFLLHTGFTKNQVLITRQIPIISPLNTYIFLPLLYLQQVSLPDSSDVLLTNVGYKTPEPILEENEVRVRGEIPAAMILK